MKLSRIVKKRTDKRNEKNFLVKEIGAGLLFVFLLPYVCASLWGYAGEEWEQLVQAGWTGQEDNKTGYTVEVMLEWGKWEIPLEEYLVYKLAEVMPKDYEEEALMAQAVLLRTECVRKAGEQGKDTLRVEDSGLAKWYRRGDIGEELSKYKKAVQETKDIYLSYEGEPVLAAYFYVSNGKTRNAGEVWNTAACPYLQGTSSEQDKAAKEYRSTVIVPKKEYLEKMRELTGGVGTEKLTGEKYAEEELCEKLDFTYDSAGYVTYVSDYCDGETFRHLFGLNSACFEMEAGEDSIVFHVKGVGHGFGLSQYGANAKAINGETFREILADYFSGAQLTKIE